MTFQFLGIAPNLGFRFVGANVYNAVDKSVEKLDKVIL